jgi:hypothetical protein
MLNTTALMKQTTREKKTMLIVFLVNITCSVSTLTNPEPSAGG